MMDVVVINLQELPAIIVSVFEVWAFPGIYRYIYYMCKEFDFV